ncbi:MAG: PPOX class F420-dependent oxidoreductase [Micrococcales bacterium]|nr:PPOX class F420-dependent oxidoreductase [Micrococcales bacterium]
MGPEIDLLDLGDESFVSLTTFRKNGDGVPTTVWVARDGDALIVTTNDGTGKVKRLRNDPRVQLRPSTRRGKVEPDAPVASGVAAILRDEESGERLHRIFTAKYGLQFTAIMGVESRLLRSRGDRVVLRITAR